VLSLLRTNDIETNMVSDNFEMRRSQLFQVKQQLGHAQDQQARLQETGKLWQRQLEAVNDELQAELETNRWLRKELEQKTREMLARAANAKEPPEFLADTTRDMDASLQATERHIALVARLANQR
jgi:chromosome segregation ATPase